MRQKLLFLFVMLFCITKSNAQSNWSLRGNSVNDTDFVGTTNAQNLMFKANNISSFKVKPNGRVNFMYSAAIDSVLDVDSIHARVIRVGNHSLVLGSSYLTTSDDITSTNSAISFGGDPSVTTFDNIQLMIGTHTAQQKLHISDGSTNAVRMQYTNSGTGTTSSDGFQIGILGGGSNGHAVFNQQENLPMLFNTNAAERMRILGNGNVGINTTSPNNKLEITHGTSGNSGLRFTDLTNASSSITNTTDKILSVNSNGDVILVDDKQGTGGGGVNYCTSVPNDFLMKKDAATNNLCASGVYEVPSGTYINNIGIGTGANNNIRAKLNVAGNAKIGSNYAGNTVNAPADGALIEGNTGIGRSNANAQNTVDARLHVDVSSGAGTRNFFFGTARDRSVAGAQEQAFRMFTNGTLGYENAVIQSVGHTGLGLVEAVASNNVGVRLTSSIAGANIAGIEPANQAADRLAIGGDTIFPNTTTMTTGGVPIACTFTGAYLGDYTHHWGRIYTNDIWQARNPNPTFFRIRPGNIRDDDPTNACAMYIQTGLLYQNASYLRIIGPPTAGGANFCNNTGINNIVPVFDVGRLGNIGVNQFAPLGPNTTLAVNGEVLAQAYNVPSDTRIKSNVNDYSLGLDAIRNVNVKSYTYNGKVGITDTSKVYVGVMAQEVMQQIPDAVDTYNYRLNNPSDTTEAIVPIYRVNTNAVLYTSINAIKELDAKNQELENKNQELTQALEQQAQKIDEMMQRLDECCRVNPDGNRSGQINQNENNSEFNSLKVDLSSVNRIVLNQNEPNPFKEKTTIRYTIPTEVKQAEIIFFDQQGSVIKTVLIETRGVGQLEVYSSNLSAGTYSYSLVADGNSVDTKKMVNTK